MLAPYCNTTKGNQATSTRRDQFAEKTNQRKATLNHFEVLDTNGYLWSRENSQIMSLPTR